MIKQLLTICSFVLFMTGCSSEESTISEEKVDNSAVQQEKVETNKEWMIDTRLQEPTEETLCDMCEMKVYTKDNELGVFAGQAVKADGTIAFYDDIGCLLNAEFANMEVNEKFVRDFTSLNWIDVEKASILKTDLKSPMNFGYIFFKYEEDANAYQENQKISQPTSYTDVRRLALERRKAKMQAETNMSMQENSEMNVQLEGEQSFQQPAHSKNTNE